MIAASLKLENAAHANLSVMPPTVTQIRRKGKIFSSMAIKRRTEITIETHEVTVIHLSQHQTTMAFCERCQTMLIHLSVLRVATILGLRETAIFRLVESEQIHATESADGRLLICANSFSALAKEIKAGNQE